MILRLVDRCVEALAALVLVASTAMICANVFYRYAVLGWLRGLAERQDWAQPLYRALDAPFGAISVTADEVPGYLLVWLAFLGAYLALRRGGHISFDLLVGRLPPAWRRGLAAFVDLWIIAFLGLLFWQAVRMIRVDGATEIETAEIAQGWFMAVLPIAAVLMIAALIADIRRRWRADERER